MGTPDGDLKAAGDYYGGERNGMDHYGSSVIALNADTGQVVWQFQTVHHDVWDYDLPAQPLLFDFPGPDGPVPALAQTTKMGLLFVLNRETGQPLLPVEERPVPQGGPAPQALSATQPYPLLPEALLLLPALLLASWPCLTVEVFRLPIGPKRSTLKSATESITSTNQ